MAWIDDLFDDLRTLVAYDVTVAAQYAAFETLMLDVQEQVSATGELDTISALRASHANLMTTLAGFRLSLADAARSRLLSTSVRNPLNVASTDVNIILKELLSYMLEEGESIPGPTGMTISTVTNDGDSLTGDGEFHYDLTQDAVSVAVQNGFASSDHANVESLITNKRSDTLVFVCQSDSYQTGSNPGTESFSVHGNPDVSNGNAGIEPEGGNGSGIGTLTVGSTLITNPMFDNWRTGATGEIPNGWSADAGTPGIDFRKVTTDPYYPYTTHFLEMDDGTALSAPVTLQPGRGYTLAIIAKGTGTVEASLTDASGTPLSGTTPLDAVPGASWTTLKVYNVVPLNRPTGTRVLLECTDGTVQINGVWLLPLNWINGVGWAIIPGPEPFVVGDTKRISVVLNSTGKIFHFFRRFLKCQLPVDNSTPTIADPT